MGNKAKIIAFGILAIVGGTVGYFIAKKEVAEKVLDKIAVKFRGIEHVRSDFQNISFQLKLALKNNTGYDFGVLVGGFTIKNVRIYDRAHRLLANADVNATNVVFPANGVYELPPAQLQIGIVNAGNFLAKTKSFEEIAERFVYEIDVEAFGYEHTITVE